jgi:hypothetical protein
MVFGAPVPAHDGDHEELLVEPVQRRPRTLARSSQPARPSLEGLKPFWSLCVSALGGSLTATPLPRSVRAPAGSSEGKPLVPVRGVLIRSGLRGPVHPLCSACFPPRTNAKRRRHGQRGQVATRALALRMRALGCEPMSTLVKGGGRREISVSLPRRIVLQLPAPACLGVLSKPRHHIR